MSHMVIFQQGGGQTGYHEVDELGAAIAYVEHLRNSEGVEQARIFRMDEVSFEFRPYYKVEVGGQPAVPMPPPPPAPAPAPTMADEHAEHAAQTEHAELPPPPPASEVDAMWQAGATEPMSPETNPEAETVGSGNGNVRRGLFGR